MVWKFEKYFSFFLLPFLFLRPLPFWHMLEVLIYDEQKYQVVSRVTALAQLESLLEKYISVP